MVVATFNRKWERAKPRRMDASTNSILIYLKQKTTTNSILQWQYETEALCQKTKTIRFEATISAEITKVA